ncbi:MAG: RIP metalloprotease RseP [Candidatus Kerfeldbacteria bacterium]
MFLTVIIFIVVLGLIVFVHELGHFYSAKKLGIGVEEFGFGFPPRLFGIQKINGTKKWKFIKGSKTPEITAETKGNVIYSLNWIPIGGFVKIKGEQGDQKDEDDSFSSKKIWKRVVVLSAGVAMNFIFAFIIISIGFGIGIPNAVDQDVPESAIVFEQKIQVVEVESESPAEEAGIKLGDIIVSSKEVFFVTTQDFQDFAGPNLNNEIILTIDRAGEEIVVNVIPEDLNDNGKGAVGIWLADIGLIKYPWYMAIWMGAKTTVQITWQILVAFFELIKNLIITQEAGMELAGPVGIAVLTGQVAKLGFIYLLQFAAILSINLGIINFIPFPALDGGRVLFLLIEKIRKKPMNEKIEAMMHNFGFLLLILLVLFVTFKDISKYGDSIKGFFTNIF